MDTKDFDFRSESEKFARRIGENVRRFREEKKWTQDRLAEELGISRLSVSKLERGEFEKLNIANIVACARVFARSVEAFFIDENEIAKKCFSIAFEKLDIQDANVRERLTGGDYGKVRSSRGGR